MGLINTRAFKGVEIRGAVGAVSAALAVLGLLLVTAPSASALSASCPGQDDVITGANVAAAEESLHCLINVHRQDNGRPGLARDGRLALAARRHSQDMVNRGYFDHVAPAPAPYGRQPWDRAARAGFPSNRADISENLACRSDPVTPLQLFEDWRTSGLGHNQNMLNAKWRLSGIGIAAGTPPDCGGTGATATNLFATTPSGGSRQPKRGRTVKAHLASGTVLIDTGDGRGYVPLTGDRLIRVGSRIDACDGRIDLTTQVKGSRFQTPRFWAGRFRVLQSTGSPRLNLKLIGPLDNCSRSSRGQSLALADLSSAAAKASPSKKKKGGRRKLVGKGRCTCRSLGRRGSATTVATFWELEDLRGGKITRVRVRKGVVVFRNFYTDKRKRVRAGQTAVARPRRR